MTNEKYSGANNFSKYLRNGVLGLTALAITGCATPNSLDSNYYATADVSGNSGNVQFRAGLGTKFDSPKEILPNLTRGTGSYLHGLVCSLFEYETWRHPFGEKGLIGASFYPSNYEKGKRADTFGRDTRLLLFGAGIAKILCGGHNGENNNATTTQTYNYPDNKPSPKPTPTPQPNPQPTQNDGSGHPVDPSTPTPVTPPQGDGSGSSAN